MTWIERVFDRVCRLRPDMPDRVVVARLAAATMLVPVVLPIKLWRHLLWTRPN